MAYGDSYQGYAQSMADLIRQSGEAQARAVANKGRIWGQAIANIGPQVLGTMADLQRQKQVAQDRASMEQDRAQTRTFQQAQIDNLAADNARGDAAAKAAQDAAAARQALDQHRGFVQSMAAVDALPEAERPARYAALLSKAPVGFEGLPAEYKPGVGKALLTEFLTADEQLKSLTPPPLLQRDPTRDLVNPQTGAVVSPGMPAPPPFRAPVRVETMENGKKVIKFLPPDQVTGQTFEGQPSATSAKTVGDLTPDAVEQGAARYRLLGASSIPTRIEEPDRVAIMNKAAEQDKALGNTPAASVQKMAAYKSDATALTKMRTMSSAAEAFETKALAQADLIDKLSEKTGRTDWPIINGMVLAGKIGTGNTNAQLLANAIIGFQSEYAKILEGSTGSVAAVGEGSAGRAQKMVSAALSKGTLKETLAQMRWEMRQTMNGYDTVIGSITDRMGGTQPAATTPAAVTDPLGILGGAK